MEVTRVTVGFLQTNCYIVKDDNTNKAVIIDPGAEASRLIKIIEDNKLSIEHILITHGHFDHMLALKEIKEYTKANVIIHEHEYEYLTNPDLNLSKKMFRNLVSINADTTIKEGDIITFGDTKLDTIMVPGHTEASICYYSPKDKVVFSGDTLFDGAIGRTDFYEGGCGDLITNIKEKLLVLPEDTIVYPGHGEATTIRKEKVSNPYLNQLNQWEF